MSKMNAQMSREILVEVLAKHELLTYFIRYLSAHKGEYGGMTHSEILDIHTKRNTPFGWIDSMGRWANTKQGHDFWSNINNEFRLKLVGGGPKKKLKYRSIW